MTLVIFFMKVVNFITIITYKEKTDQRFSYSHRMEACNMRSCWLTVTCMLYGIRQISMTSSAPSMTHDTLVLLRS